jgi:hypothetical protein
MKYRPKEKKFKESMRQKAGSSKKAKQDWQTPGKSD